MDHKKKPGRGYGPGPGGNTRTTLIANHNYTTPAAVTQTESLTIRDRRKAGYYTIDTVFIRDGYAAALGVYALGVYNVLAAHAGNETQTTKLKQSTIAELLNCSARQVRRALTALEACRLIRRKATYNKRTGYRGVSEIELLDEAGWLKHPDYFEQKTLEPKRKKPRNDKKSAGLPDCQSAGLPDCQSAQELPFKDFKEEEEEFELFKYFSSLKIQKSKQREMLAAFAEAGIVTPEAIKVKTAAHMAALGPDDTIGLVIHRICEGMIDPPDPKPKKSRKPSRKKSAREDDRPAGDMAYDPATGEIIPYSEIQNRNATPPAGSVSAALVARRDRDPWTRIKGHLAQTLPAQIYQHLFQTTDGHIRGGILVVIFATAAKREQARDRYTREIEAGCKMIGLTLQIRYSDHDSGGTTDEIIARAAG